TFDSVSVSSSTSVVPMITSLSATTGPVGTQVIVGGSGFGASQGSSIVTLNDSPVTVNLWSDTSIAVTIPAGATSGYITVLRGPGMNSSNGVIFTVTSSPLPSGWFDQDIGPVSNAGSATYSGGVFTVQGSRPGLHFVYQPIATDFTIVARVTSLSQYAQGGVMIRQSLDANSSSASAFMYAYGNPPVVE